MRIQKFDSGYSRRGTRYSTTSGSELVLTHVATAPSTLPLRIPSLSVLKSLHESARFFVAARRLNLDVGFNPRWACNVDDVA